MVGVYNSAYNIVYFYGCVCCALDDEFVIYWVGVDEDVGGVEGCDAFADLHAGFYRIGDGAVDMAMGDEADAVAHIKSVAAKEVGGGTLGDAIYFPCVC